MLKINNRYIGDSHSPYIIAELSANHNGSLDRALQSIHAAKSSGADAVKIQTYSADTMTIDSGRDDFLIKRGLWSGYKLYDLYEEACTPFIWHKTLFDYAESIGITIFSTPFDESAVDLLNDLNAPAYKIASFEIVDLDLIKLVAKTGKPLLISTGMASELEIQEALEAAKSAGCNEILLFHCISSYPAPIEDMNLNQIKYLKNTFNVDVGLSDHSLTNTAAISAVALGACAIEKHFTLSRAEKGPDSEFSLEPNELTSLVTSTSDAYNALGSHQFYRPEIETENKIFRRSIYFIADMQAGETITEHHIRRIRPGFGIPPKHYISLLGRKVSIDIKRGDAVTWNKIAD
jgi:N-acetylneuraminate synthase